jgi:hypothetical protein
LRPPGLIQTKSADPLQIGKNHQVLAYGYDLNGNDLRIKIYDPNHPRDDNVTLSLNIGNPYNTTDVVHSRHTAPRDVFCFFRPTYVYREPPRSVVAAPGAWTEPKRVPGWFGWRNKGAGIAAGDINRNGRFDLAVFHIDNPGGENAGYYRVVWNP